MDNLVKSAIDDIKKVEDKSKRDIDNILSKYTDEFKILKTNSFQQLSDAIDHIDCVADKTLTQYLTEALGEFGRLISTSSFIISPPPLYIGEQECDTLHLECDLVSKKFSMSSANPAITEKELRNYLDDRVSKMGDDTPISSILTSYNIIANFAKRRDV